MSALVLAAASVSLLSGAAAVAVPVGLVGGGAGLVVTAILLWEDAVLSTEGRGGRVRLAV